MLNENEISQILNDPDNKRRKNFHIITLPVQSAGQRIDIGEIAKVENERIIGVCVFTPSTAGKLALRQSTISLTIDNQEILPKDFPCSLIMHKDEHSFYDAFMRINEPADGKWISGTFTNTDSEEPNPSDGEELISDVQYDVKLILYCIAKNKESEEE